MPTSKDLKQLLERIQLRLDESFVGIGSEVSDLPPEDLAELLNQLSLAEAAAVVSMLHCRAASSCAISRRCAAQRSSNNLNPLAWLRSSKVCPPTNGPTSFKRWDCTRRHRILPKFSPEVRAELEDLLQYPDHTAGGIMTTEFVRLDPKMTVSDALRHIRSVAREKGIHLCVLRDGPGYGSFARCDFVARSCDGRVGSTVVLDHAS